MFRLTEPTNSTIVHFIESQRKQTYTYSAVGATNRTPPADFTVDHNRIHLGIGEQTYHRAIEALMKWRQFDLGWVTIVPKYVPVAVGEVVAVKAHTFGLWSLNAARVVYSINEERLFGFAYGTLPSHVECGEERFLIEWAEDDSVWYDILAFSKPRHPLVRLGFPLARALQERFARESLQRMVVEVQR